MSTICWRTDFSTAQAREVKIEFDKPKFIRLRFMQPWQKEVRDYLTNLNSKSGISYCCLYEYTKIVLILINKDFEWLAIANQIADKLESDYGFLVERDFSEAIA